MKAILERIFKNPRTTLAGLLGVVVSALAVKVLPDVIGYLGMQDGLGWQALAYLIGLVVPALMKDRAAPAELKPVQ